jgi:Protein of unknown function (DUF1064)
MTSITISEYHKLPKTKRKSAYVAIRTNGFDSKAEAGRYGELKILEKRGEIFGLSCHPKYVLIDKSEFGREIIYSADFEYVDAKTGATIVEDVKPKRSRDKKTGKLKRAWQSRDFPLRKRMFEERYRGTHELRIKEIG